MLKTLAVSFRLRNTYKANGVIWSLKSIPLIRRLLPASLYASEGLKVFANIIGVFAEIFTAFSGKALYLLCIYFLTLGMKTPASDSYAHVLLFLTVIGGMLNTQIFNPTKDKFYAIFLMRINAREYTVINYLYFLVKMLVGFLVFTLIFGGLAGMGIVACLAVPLYVLEVKLLFTAFSLNDCKRQCKAVNENKPAVWVWVGVVVLMLAAVVPPYFGFALGEKVLLYIAAALLVPSVFALRHILRFDAYRPIYKELLRPENFAVSTDKSAAGAAQQIAMQNKITADVSSTSNKSGYKYFNELFMKRHARLLTKSAKRITIISAILLAASVTALYIFPEAKAEVNGILLTYLPYFLFLMYLINRGKVITQAMFMNCDHSMLAYRFYRQPKALLSLFVERLKYIISINLMPAAVIALGLPLLLYVTGGTDEPLNYFLLFISIIAMSIFFSVHNMVLYYLLQPYNVNLESKSAAYGIVNYITYIVCYSAIRFEIPTLIFGSAISAFCIIYAVVAFILAYRLAPRTFKLRQ